ncbi:MAG: hypothetical protein WA941_00705 [Nitrososphaeraceae archaeon]
MSSLSRRASIIFLLILLSGFFAIAFGGLDHIYVQGTVDCDRQTFSLIDCPESSSEEEGPNNDDDDNGQNIELHIPSVIPFP